MIDVGPVWDCAEVTNHPDRDRLQSFRDKQNWHVSDYGRIITRTYMSSAPPLPPPPNDNSHVASVAAILALNVFARASGQLIRCIGPRANSVTLLFFGWVSSQYSSWHHCCHCWFGNFAKMSFVRMQYKRHKLQLVLLAQVHGGLNLYDALSSCWNLPTSVCTARFMVVRRCISTPLAILKSRRLNVFRGHLAGTSSRSNIGCLS